MHALAPRPTDPGVPVFLNVDTSVGYMGSNSSPDDILLVQFLLRVGAEEAPVGATPEGELRRQTILRVEIGGPVNATMIGGIRAFQEVLREKNKGTIVDGRVSPAQGYRYGAGFFTIVSLNLLFRKNVAAMNIWPRIDKHPRCPEILKKRLPQVL